jgi:hypothetical protein
MGEYWEKNRWEIHTKVWLENENGTYNWEHCA